MSIYRNSVWFLKGLFEYTAAGFERARRHFVAEDLTEVQLDGRSFLITGSNSGIGKAVAAALAKQGGQVHMACRDVTKAEQVRDEIIAQTGNQEVYVHPLDLSKPRQVIAFARQFAESHPKLDVLINNAGCLLNKRTVTEDGLESTFAVNSFGPYLLTWMLLDSLGNSSDGRVIFVSSAGMLVQGLNVADPCLQETPYDGTMAYAQTKRQQVVLAELLAAKYPKIKFYSCHPGWADTPGVETSLPAFHSWMKSRLRSVDQGGDTIVWLAASKAAAAFGQGEFFQDRHQVSKHLPMASTDYSEADADRFWQYMEHLRCTFLTETK